MAMGPGEEEERIAFILDRTSHCPALLFGNCRWRLMLELNSHGIKCLCYTFLLCTYLLGFLVEGICRRAGFKDLGFCVLAKYNFLNVFLSRHDLWPTETEAAEQRVWTQGQDASN